jgi:hypothetical protein
MKFNWLSTIILLTFQKKSSKCPPDHPLESFLHKSVLAITALYIKITSNTTTISLIQSYSGRGLTCYKRHAPHPTRQTITTHHRAQL